MNPETNLSLIDLVFNSRHKMRTFLVSIMILIFLGWITFITVDTRFGGPSPSELPTYSLRVTGTSESRGIRQEAKLLIYTETPSSIKCDNVAISVPLAAYQSETTRPKPGDIIDVQISPNAVCSSNGKFISGDIESNATRAIIESLGVVFLISICLLGIIWIIIGMVYALSEKFRIYYRNHKFIPRLLFAVFVITFAIMTIVYFVLESITTPITGFVVAFLVLVLILYKFRKK